MSETRYRRWLALYPRDFRREYEEEILGVLSADGRRGPGQVIDLVRAALAVRLRRAAAAGEWRRAAAVVQLFGAILLFTIAARRVVYRGWYVLAHPDAALTGPDTVDWVRMAGWAVVVIAACAGWRAAGAAGATAGLAGEVASPVRYYLDTPATVLNVYWFIVAAAVVLVAGLVARRADARARGLPAIVAAGLVLVAHGFAPVNLGGYDVHLVPLALPAALALIGVLRQEAVVRRWMLVWAAPVLCAVPLIRSGFDGFIEYNMRHPESLRFIDPLQWTVLVLFPVAVFLAAAALARRYESGHRAASDVSGGAAPDK